MRYPFHLNRLVLALTTNQHSVTLVILSIVMELACPSVVGFFTLLLKLFTWRNCSLNILPTKTTAARNGVALSYRSVRGLYFLAVVFVRSMVSFST